jgi:outer membrane biosynthesis protein TonB
MNEDRTGRWLAAFIIASLALHALVFGSAGRRAREVRKPPALVTMEVMKLPPRALPPPPPPRVPAPRSVRRAIAAVPAAPRPAPPPPAAAAPPPVADFTGVTLTNDGASAAGWASAVANGQPSKEPAAPPRPAPAPPAPEGPAIVAPADLRRPPEAPGLDEALARNYPEEQRRQGLAGVAVVRARVLADGHVRPLRVVSATAPAFAEACKRTLADSRWSQPLDREARPCATDISYTCRFELGQ